jgi:superfamily II DNA/RNA helicase
LCSGLLFRVKTRNKKGIVASFDPNVRNQKDDIRILITTDVLAEGINLHRSNVIVNYDIPWNPTRVLQRVGRINRVGTSFKEIHIYNFFPVGTTEKELGLEAAAVAKLQAFHQALGEDAKYLTEEEEVDAHGLFEKINTVREEEGEESFIRYIKLLREIREKDPELFEKIKRLPKKARSGRFYRRELLITLFRKGNLKKIYLCYKGRIPQEIDFLEAIRFLETDVSEKSMKIPVEDYYVLLTKNRMAFNQSLQEETARKKSRKSFSRTEQQLVKELKALRNAVKNKENRESVQNLLDIINTGKVSKKTLKDLNKKIKGANTFEKKLKVLEEFLSSYYFEEKEDRFTYNESPVEVILSQYFGG